MTSSPYTVCRPSWMTDTLDPRAHSYRITARTSIGDHVASTRLSAIVICTRITSGTPVCCYSLFFGALRMRHSSSADAASVVEPAKGVDCYGDCLFHLVYHLLFKKKRRNLLSEHPSYKALLVCLY